MRPGPLRQVLTQDRVTPAMARCWALTSQDQPRVVAVEYIREARRLDHRQASVLRLGMARAEEWESHREALLELGDLAPRRPRLTSRWAATDEAHRVILAQPLLERA